MKYPYTVCDTSGKQVIQADERCRYSKETELSLLGAGYTLRLHGKKLTKTEIARRDKYASRR